MKKTGLLLIGLSIAIITNGQTLNIQGGTSISKLDWKIGTQDIEPFKQILIGYSVFAGIDYFDKTYFNLSSNLGFIRKGGKGTFTITNQLGEPIDEFTQKVKLDYVTVNTTFDIKYPIRNKIIPFISVGPRIDYLINYSKEIDGLNDINALEKYNIGLILGGGIKYNFSKIQIGLRADYYLNFNKIADWPAEIGNLGGSVKDKTMSINLIFVYNI